MQEYQTRMDSLSRPEAAQLPADKLHEARREADRLAGQVQALIQLKTKRSALLLNLEESCRSMSAPAPTEDRLVRDSDNLIEEGMMEEDADQAHSNDGDIIDPIVLHNGEPTLLPEVIDAEDQQNAERRWLAMNTV